MNERLLNCMRCGSHYNTDDRFCRICGSDLLFQKKLSSKKVKISLKWVIFSIVSIFVFEYICAVIAGKLFVLISDASLLTLEASMTVSSIGALIGIFLGTLYSAYMSPGLSIKEPLIGAISEILVSQLILFTISGIFSYLYIIRIIVITTVALFGIKTGLFIQKKGLKLQNIKSKL